MKTNMTIIFLASIFFLSFTTNNAHAFRCGLGLVTTGDTKTQVQMTCGKPTSREKRCKKDWTTTSKSGTTKKNKCSEKVEVWYYNCGDGDFLYALTFEDNVLTSENTEGRGKGNSDCQGK
jgi:hypothetical protein